MNSGLANTPRHQIMPRLLFLSHNLPYPPVAGVLSRTFNFVRELSQAFEIDLLCLYRREHHPDPTSVEDAVRVLSQWAHTTALPLQSSYSKAQFLQRHLTSLLGGQAYTLHVYRSSPFAQAISQHLTDRAYAIAHIDSLVLAGYLPLVADLQVACGHHNVESELLRRSAAKAGHRLKSAYVRLQAERVERLERQLCQRCQINVVVSERDRTTLQQISPTARFEVVDNGVDCTYFHPQDDAAGSPDVVWVGGLSWSPNWDAVVYFAEQILPLIRSNSPGTRFLVVGNCSTTQRHLLEKYPSVVVIGRVDDVRPYVWQSGCFVVPLRVGGGTRIKILDAWAMGKAVVSTPIGSEGLAAKDAENILIRSEPEHFAAAVVELLANKNLSRRLARAGRETAVRRYAWSVLGEKLRRLYGDIARPVASERALRASG